MPNPLRDSFDFVVESYEQWYQALKNPRSAVRSALRQPSRREKIRAATNLWFAAFFLSIIVSLPVYYGFGLKLENVSFQVAYVVAQYVIIGTLAAIVHVGFRVCKIASRLADTFVMTAIPWAVVMPFITLFSLHKERLLLADVSAMKKRGLSLADGIATLGDTLDDTPGRIETIFSVFAEACSMVLGMAAIAMLIRAAAEHYRAAIPQTIRAFSFGVVVLAPLPAAVMGLLYFVLYYAFVT